TADGGQDGRTALILVADQVAEHALDVERVRAEDAVLDPLVDERLDRLLLPFQRGFAETGQAGIGRQAHEQVVAQPGVGQERFELSDLHGGTLTERDGTAKQKHQRLSPSNKITCPTTSGSYEVPKTNHAAGSGAASGSTSPLHA